MAIKRWLHILLFISVGFSGQAIEAPDSVFVNTADTITTRTIRSVTITPDDTIFEVTTHTRITERWDSVKARTSPTEWITQLIDNGFHINDPGVDYPKFPQFLLKVYNWGDRTFNSYDPRYVEATGKNWKILGKSYNWLESYRIFFPHRMRVSMFSDLYSDIGPYLNFMAVSIGYSFNANELVRRPVAERHNFEFNFTCALFSGSYRRMSTKGGMRITEFGDYKKGHHLSQKFNDVEQETTTADLYYFFNHRKYSHAAAYCYSKYQLRSAGTWIIGVDFTTQLIHIDFENLPEDMLQYLPGDATRYSFHYSDYNLLGGYAHNWVLKPKKWLINLTVLPAVGYKHLYSDSGDGRKDMFSANIRANTSVVFNHRALFASLIGNFYGHAYFGNSYTFFNSVESLTLTVGARF